MKKRIAIYFFLLLIYGSCFAQQHKVALKKSTKGFTLQVKGKNFFIVGMNWDYFPIGTNYSYSLWQQSEELIKAALDHEMTLLRNMGVNAIRQYTGVPVKWVNYIYEKYGIYTMLNHSFGRYGLTLKDKWEPNTDYANPLVKAALLKEVKEMVREYSNAPGILLFLLGNENNYGLFWQGAETENIPVKDRKSTIAATALYKLFNEAVVAMKSINKLRPIAICNGDLLYLDIITKNCTAVDILGINIYRGLSFGDAYEKVKKNYGKPVMLTEFGADAYNTIANTEDEDAQSDCLKSNWKEIYANAAGMGKAGNSIGGFTFQFSDGWWKAGQTFNLDKHDITASWSNGGYQNDFKKGVNNMNEEWFGICAKGPLNEKGVYALYPRTAYYTLKKVHGFNPYAYSGKLGTKALNNIFSSTKTEMNRLDSVALQPNEKKNLLKTKKYLSKNIGLSIAGNRSDHKIAAAYDKTGFLTLKMKK